MNVKKIIRVFLLNLFVVNLMQNSPVLQGYSDDLFTHMDDKLVVAQDDFEAMYKDLFEHNFFSEAEKDLSLKYAINKNVLQTGPILLNLIEWIQRNKSNDPVAQGLMHKLDRYIYFVFRDFINEIEMKKTDRVDLDCLLHKLYKFKTEVKKSSKEIFREINSPFRATLSKAMIFILIVNQADLSYKEKVKHIFYYLDKIKRELFEIKKSLLDCSVTNDEIDKFIEFMQAYAVAEPLFKPSFLKTFFKFAVVFFIVSVIICAVLYFVIKKFGENIEGYLKNLLGELDKKSKDSPITCAACELIRFLLEKISPRIHQPEIQIQEPRVGYLRSGWQKTKNFFTWILAPGNIPDEDF